MRPRLLALGPFLPLFVAALPAEPAPVVEEPLPFDHALHEPALVRAGALCTDCHPVGLSASDAPAPDQALAAPTSSCHGCHLDDYPGAPRQAERWCSDCHPARPQLIPDSHGPSWPAGHGRAARPWRSDCDDCHRTAECVDCHDARGAGVRSPHGAGFATLHGVEARLDPAACARCHTAETCADCHSSGTVPW